LINIKNMELKSLKKKIILVTVLLGFFSGLYILVIIPYKKNSDLASEIQNNYQKIEKLREEKITTEKILEKSQDMSQENRDILESLYFEFERITFEDLGTFEKYVENLSTKNKLEISIIGRVERVQMNEAEKLYKMRCPYEILGTEEDIYNFLVELESSKYLIDVISAPILIETGEEKSKITLKLTTSMKESEIFKESKENFENFQNQEKKFPLNSIIKNIREYSIIRLNNTQYIVIHTKDKKKKIFKEMDEIKIDDVLYKIKIISEEIYLEFVK